MKKLLLTAASAAILSTTSIANAEFAVDMFYAKPSVGAVMLQDVKFNSQKLDNKGNVFAGLEAGYYMMENLRVGLAFDYYFDPEHKKGDRKLKSSLYTLMANVYLDLFDLSVAKVYVGVGVGGARVKGKYTETNVDLSAKEKNNFAYSGTLGVSTEFAPGVHGELSYSYRGFGKTKSIQSGATKNEFDLKGNHSSIGVRFDL